MIKSAQQKVLAQRKHKRLLAEFNKEIEMIEVEDPLCTLKKSSKNT